MGYVDKTAKCYRLWAPDLGQVITSHAVKFSKNEKGGSIELKLQKPATPNMLPECRLVGRPHKNPAPILAPAAILQAPTAVTMATPDTLENNIHNALKDLEQTVQGNMEIELPGPDLEVPTALKTKVLKPMEVVKQSSYIETSKQQKRELTGLDLEVPTSSVPKDTTARTGPSDYSYNTSAPGTKAPDQVVRQFLPVKVPRLRKEDDNKPAAEQPKQSPLAETPSKRQRENEHDQAKDQHIAKRLCAMLALMANEQEDDQVDRSQPKGVEIHTPTSYSEAVGDPVWGELWKEAIEAELTALASNGTWKEVVLPKCASIVTSKWVFKPKLQTDGKLDKLKARIVARGFLQMHGINYKDTFAPTVKYNTLCTFLAIIAMEDVECHQVDVNNAFTKLFLKEEIYMAAPPGVKVAPGRVLQILRSLYGLKQAVRD